MNEPSPTLGTAAAPAGELVLESAELRLTLAPARGGRIISLQHRPTGQEILWRQAPHSDWPRYGVPEAEADVQGWDECCPAIGPGPFPPGPWQGVANPAQGEVYALPWRVLHADSHRAILSIHGVRFPYELERDVELVEPNMVRARYCITNHCALPFPFIWSAHPLLAAGRGARIVLPEGAREAIIDSSEGGRLGAAYDRVSWPHAHAADGTMADLAAVQPGAGWADKLYVPEMAEGWCRLERADGLRIGLTWDAAAIPFLGIWVDTRGEGNACVALEPCLGYPDLLVEAARWGHQALLPLYGERRWEIVMTVN